MAKFVKHGESEKIDAIFCSPTNRCQETMEKMLEGREDNVMISKNLVAENGSVNVLEVESKSLEN